MSQVIVERRKNDIEGERYFALKVAEAQARAVVSALSGLAQGKRQAAELAKFAKKLRFTNDPEDGEGEKELPSSAKVMSLFGPQQNGLVGGR